jgi:hypothetical protein
MKKTKLQKLTAIKKNLENRLTKINAESYRIQCILQEYNPFFKKVELSIKDLADKDYWFELLTKARDGDEDALKLLRVKYV